MSWIERLTRPAGAVALFLLLAVLVNAPYLWGGFQADDLIFLNLIEQDSLPFSRWHGMWSTVDVPAFQHAWWRDPAALGAFWRPLPSLLIEGSVRLLGPVAFPLHLASLLLHGGVAATLVLIVRRLGGAPWVALLSGLFFLLCEDHSMGVGWIATITDMMCVQGCMLALLFHLRWLQERRWPWMVASLLAMGLGMACKESGVVAPIVLVVTTGLFPTGRVEASELLPRILRGVKDPASWLPQLALVPLYLGAYKAMGMGGMDNLMYLDPMANPAAYSLRLFTHLPPLWLASLTPMMTSLVIFEPALRAPLAVSGALTFACFLVVLWPLRRQALLPWGLGLYLLTLLPQLGADATERALYLPTVFLAPVLALLVVRWAPVARRLALDPLPGRIAWLGGAWVSLGVLATGAVLSLGYPWMFVGSLNAPLREAETAAPVIAEHQPEIVAVLTTSGMMATLYTADMVDFASEHPVEAWPLSSGHGVWSVERLDADSIVIRTDRAGWLTNMFTLMMRSEPELVQGRTIPGPVFDAVLLELTDDRRDVLAVRFDFAMNLDDPRLLLISWNGEAFERVDPNSLAPGVPAPLLDNHSVWDSMM